MLVAKLPGSTYAIAATKAGPRNVSRRAKRARAVTALGAGRSKVAVGGGALTGSTATRIIRTRSPPSACSPEAKRTVSGPSNGWRSITSSRSPGAMPRSDR